MCVVVVCQFRNKTGNKEAPEDFLSSPVDTWDRLASCDCSLNSIKQQDELFAGGSSYHIIVLCCYCYSFIIMFSEGIKLPVVICFG